MSTQNIDLEAMRAAGVLLKEAQAKFKSADIENLATKGLGVVLEQGVYAGLLFFYSQPDFNAKPDKKKGADLFVKMLVTLSNDLVKAPAEPRLDWQKPLNTLDYVANTVCQNIQQAIWVKTVWEQTLTYVRYGAKTLDKAGG